METTRWQSFQENKWCKKFTRTNYFFIMVEPFEDGSYEITCMDAELDDYSDEDKELVRNKFDIGLYSDRELAFRVMEHKEFYEWKAKVANRKELIEYLDGWTSLPVHLLKNLKEYKDLDTTSL